MATGGRLQAIATSGRQQAMATGGRPQSAGRLRRGLRSAAAAAESPRSATAAAESPQSAASAAERSSIGSNLAESSRSAAAAAESPRSAVAQAVRSSVAVGSRRACSRLLVGRTFRCRLTIVQFAFSYIPATGRWPVENLYRPRLAMPGGLLPGSVRFLCRRSIGTFYRLKLALFGGSLPGFARFLYRRCFGAIHTHINPHRLLGPKRRLLALGAFGLRGL